MENQKLDPAASQPYPWYDDRVETVRKDDTVWMDDPVRKGETVQREYVNPWADDGDDGDDGEAVEEPKQYTPREIYDYLNQHVWGQAEAKKAASVIMYQCLQGIKSNAIFTGPSGSGKTFTWRVMKQLFPGRIVISDASNINLSGWKGDKTWASLLTSPIFRSGNHCILVLDEADKMLTPKFNHSENVSQSIQGEGLTMMEGTCVDVKDGSVIHKIDTSKISFVLCGAFSNKAHDIAEKSSGARIGFGAAPEPVLPYARPLTEQDLLDFGVMPEFLGRIQRIVNLQPMSVDDYYYMTATMGNVLQHIGGQYRAIIRLSPQKRRELAEQAYATGLGVRGMENQIRRLIDDAIFEDCKRHDFEF